MLTKRPSDRSLDAIIMSDESDGGPDDRKLRLKGKAQTAWFVYVIFNIKKLQGTIISLMRIICIHLGQMIYMDNWRMMMYLGTPVMPDLNSLIITGLYINDLSMHDFSRYILSKYIFQLKGVPR